MHGVRSRSAARGRRLRLRAGTSLLALLLALLAGSAGADLVERDLLAPGDGLVTRDLDNGLDWLDVTLTQGLAAQEVLAGAGGYIDDGWRPAVQSEFCAFATTHVGSYPECSTVEVTSTRVFRAPGDSDAIAAADQVTQLLGVTLLTDVVADSIGWLADDDLGDGEGDRAFFTWYLDGSQAQISYYPNSRGDLDRVSPSQGTFLVRVIPEPTTALMLGAGLVVLGMRRRSSSSPTATRPL